MSRIVLNEIENQYGELVDEEFLVYQGKGRWDYYYLQCYSSSDLGLGTCQCVSHSPYRLSKTIGVKEMKEFLEEKPSLISQLSDEEKEYIKSYNESIVTRILNDLLVAIDLSSVEELEKCISSCYKIDVNPLPRLREVLKELGYSNVEVMYAIAQEYVLPPEPEKEGEIIIVVWHYVEDNEVSIEVIE